MDGTMRLQSVVTSCSTCAGVGAAIVDGVGVGAAVVVGAGVGAAVVVGAGVGAAVVVGAGVGAAVFPAMQGPIPGHFE